MYSRKCTQNSGSLKPEGPGDPKTSYRTEDKTHYFVQDLGSR